MLKGTTARLEDIREVVDILEQALAKPPSRAGRRLCSERDLSVQLGVDRMRIRRSFDQLVKKGILMRRHGSGTYVRKVPKFPVKLAKLGARGRSLLPAEELFAKPAVTPVRRQPHGEQRRLHLAILVDEQWKGESNRSIVTGIMDRAKQTGHHLVPLSANGNCEDIDESTSLLIEKLQTHRCDGYVLMPCHAPLREQIFQGMERVFQEKRPPLIFIGGDTERVDLRFTPVVRIDTEEAIGRAIRQLAAEGFRRIGFIGATAGVATRNREEHERKLYEGAMSELGLAYNVSEFCPTNSETTFPLVQQMFSRSDRPEAVYVADDVVLRHVALAWKAMGIVPGTNLGVITLAVRGNPLPAGLEWSRMEFNPFQVGRIALDCLLAEIQTAGEEVCSFAHLAVWRPGRTHSSNREHLALNHKSAKHESES